ncbi:MAG TPA: tetratricopeptide repeat protein [Pyrinomonadaceae bacterium]|jgi:Tfp pilus assembly protein PilF/nitrate/TMAO reductase-like tetraheme cytochrome c subunit
MIEAKNHKRRLIFVATVIGVAVCAVSFVRPYTVNGDKPAEDTPKASPANYAATIAETYDFKFGPNPFAPSNASSQTGTFIVPEKFVASTRCGTCHTDAHAQWRQSAHANAFREPFYQKNVKDLQSQKGIEFTRHCESCHNPAALFTGALTKNSKVKRPFDEDGVSCIACHSIQSATGRGIGGYVMGEPALLVKEDGTQLLAGVTDQQILDDIPSHRRAMMRPLLKSAEFCAACHKSQVPRELNDYKFLRAFSVGDEYQMSSFSKESPHPYYVRDKETCNSCHMKREPAPLFDVSAKQGKLASHRWPAANTAIPVFYKWPEQLDAVNKFLETDVVGIDIFALRRKSPGNGPEDFIAPLNRGSFSVKPSDRITAEVVITNKNIGHSFPPELRDFYEAFVEFTVTDESGKTLYQSGFIKPNGYLDESAHNYKSYLVKLDGSFNDKHQIWRTRGVAQNNQIQSGRSDVARYQFRVPAQQTGSLRIKARVRYRRFTRVFSDYTLGKSADYPIVSMAATEYVMRIGENSPVAAADIPKTAMPDWRRWNNYGIALMDQKQYPLAIDAFIHAAALDEKYRATAQVNQAIGLIELDQFDRAAALLEAVVRANPENMRALFQQARVFIRRGQLDEAEANLRRVLAAFPRDRLSLQQLGELCKIKHDYQVARECYEKILAIDPEDLGAHYNLMLLFRKLGMKEEAKREGKIFAELKDDPGALPLANMFLRKHPEMSNESVFWHIHDLSPAGNVE